MHVHLLTNLFPPDVLGGYELLARDVRGALQERGHRVDVLTSGDGSEQEGVNRSLLLSRAFGSEPGRDRARHLLAAAWNRRATSVALSRSGRPDAVLVMSLRRLGLEPLRVYGEAGVPSVLTVNDDWPVAFVPQSSGLGAALERGAWARHTWRGVGPSRVVYLSDSIRQLVLDAGAPLPAGRVQAQGVPLSLFAPRAFRPLPASPSLLFAGRVHPSKAPEMALDAVHALRVHHGIEATLTVAGAPCSVSYRDELRSRCETLGIERQVRWLGQVDRQALPDVYRAADVFLFPSAFAGEGQGLTYMEAMACGVPVVAYPQGGARDVLGDGRACELVERGDGEAFAAAIVRLARDEARTRSRVEAGQALVQQTSLDRYVDVLERELLEQAALARHAS